MIGLLREQGLLWGALLGLALVPSAADAVTVESGKSQSLAGEFAALLSPPEIVRLNSLRSAEISIDRGLAQDPNLPPAEKIYPGLSAAMKEAGLVAVRPVIEAVCLDLAKRQRDLIEKSFNSSEIHELIAFYSGPAAAVGTASAITNAKNALRPADKQKIMENAGAGVLTSDEFSRMIDPGTPPVLPQSVEKAYVAFSQSPVGKKLDYFTPIFEKLMLDWLNDSAPQVQSAITTSMMAKAKSYIEDRSHGK